MNKNELQELIDRKPKEVDFDRGVSICFSIALTVIVLVGLIIYVFK